MFMSIDVRDLDPGGLNLANLGAGLGFNFLRVDPSSEGAGGEGLEAVSKMWGGRMQGGRVSGGESGDTFRRKRRDTVDQHDIAADTQSWSSSGQMRSLRKGGAVRHQRR